MLRLSSPAKCWSKAPNITDKNIFIINGIFNEIALYWGYMTLFVNNNERY